MHIYVCPLGMLKSPFLHPKSPLQHRCRALQLISMQSLVQTHKQCKRPHFQAAFVSVECLLIPQRQALKYSNQIVDLQWNFPFCVTWNPELWLFTPVHEWVAPGLLSLPYEPLILPCYPQAQAQVIHHLILVHLTHLTNVVGNMDFYRLPWKLESVIAWRQFHVREANLLRCVIIKNLPNICGQGVIGDMAQTFSSN